MNISTPSQPSVPDPSAPEPVETAAASPVAVKRTSAKGAIPKEMKSWALIIVAALVIIVIWFSGTPPPKNSKPGAALGDTHQQQSVNGLTPEDVQQRLQVAEDNRKADLRPSTQTPSGQAAQPGDPRLGPDAAFLQTNQPQAPPPPRDPIAEEERKREYLSRFASNIALSYRPDASTASLHGSAGNRPQPAEVLSETDSSQDLDTAAKLAPAVPLDQKFQQQLQALQNQQQQLLAQQQTNAAASLVSSLSPNVAGSQAQPAQAAPAPSTVSKVTTTLNSAAGKSHVIFEGTVLETVLVNRLNGDFTGPVICQLTTDLYSHDHSTVLLPAGSRVLGEARKVADIGQTRLAVMFHRLIMPDGFSVDLDQAPGLNQIGETALHDTVNNHYFKIFGASIAVGAIAGLAAIGTNNSTTGLPASGSDAYRQGVASNLSQSSLRILDKFLNIPPTITIREGHRVRIFLTQDLQVPSYGQHKMPSDL